MSTKQHFYELRTNTRFAVKYEDSSLQPEIELIFLTGEPEYELVKKGKDLYIQKGQALREFRIMSTPAGLNELIGELQATAAGLTRYSQLATGLNRVIEQAKATDLPHPVQKPEEGK